MSKIRIGIDIGGTFTDIVILNEEGNLSFGKTLTTYPDPSDGVLKGLDENLKKYKYAYGDIETIIHGTTLVVNALIERKGVKTALITTKGFRDQLEIGTENRHELYDLFVDKPTPLVPRHLRRGVTERMFADGLVSKPLNEDEVKRVFKDLDNEGVEATAVCLLHSYVNASHERRIYDIAKEVVPHMQISISSEVSPEIREYQRASTTIANVYVQPLVESYLRKLEKELKNHGFNGQFHMMLSGGGTCTIDTACRFPIRILESGPIGGAMAASFYSELCNLSNLLVFDMGGTTAKASLVDNGVPLVTNEFEVGREDRFIKGSGIPVKVPVIEMIEIGAGGGSIAHIDRLGLLKVGPESASSEPGPACYQKGGTFPTITDADLVLGYLNPDFFLGGEMKLDIDAAKKAIKEKIAKPLGISLAEAAWGIHRVVNENMASAARIHAVERGKDIRDYPMFATGGAGPVHACNVAQILDVSTVISPIGAGVGSAFGFLSSPIAFDFVRSYAERLEQLNWDYVMKLLTGMEEEGKQIITQAGISPNDIEIIRTCEMRYVGQTHEITVSIPGGELNEVSSQQIKENFIKAYEELYTEASDSVPMETLNWRVVVKGSTPELFIKHNNASIGDGSIGEPLPKNERMVYDHEQGDYKATPVYGRERLEPHMTIQGPAIIEERESTMVMPKGYSLQVDPYYNLIIQKEAKKEGDVTNGSRYKKESQV